MTEHWNPINSNWSKNRYEDRLESANDEIDRASGSKLSGDTNVQHGDIEQISYTNDDQGLSQPQREPVELHPGNFGGYGMDLFQDSGLKNGSEDMVSRVPPTCYDTNKLKSAATAPPTYQEKPPMTHEKNIEFFGDSHVAGRGSRSTLDQDSLHRGSINTLPSAGQRRGSALSTAQRRESSSRRESSQGYESYQNHRTSTSSTTNESQGKKSSLVNMAVGAVATVGAGAAAAASGVSNALMGNSMASPTEEKSKEMPSTWPNLESNTHVSNTTGSHFNQNENRSSHTSEHHASSQSRTSQSYGIPSESRSSGLTSNANRTSLDYGQSAAKQHLDFEPAMHGQNAYPYAHDSVCDQVTEDKTHPFCDVEEPVIRGQNPSYYGHDETTDHNLSDMSKARRWSEGWSRQNTSQTNPSTISQSLLATTSTSQAEKSRLDDAQNAFQSRLDGTSQPINYQSSQSGTSRRRSSDILGLASSQKTGKLNIETITSSSLHAAQYGTTRRRSSNISDSLLDHRLSTSSSTSYRDNLSSSTNSYSNAVRRESKLHEDFDQTLENAPANKVKSFKGVLAAGGGGIVGSGLTYAQTMAQPSPTVDESEDDNLSPDSGLPPAWGDQPLPIPPRNSSEVAKDASITHGHKADTGSSIKSAISSTTQAASSVATSVPNVSQFDEYDGIRVRGWNDNQDFSQTNSSETHMPQDHGYSREQDYRPKGVLATASAAALGALGGLGFGHRTSATYIDTEDNKYHDSGSSQSTSLDKKSDHVAPTGWLSNADNATPPPQQWSEVDQHLETKGWSDANRRLPTGTGHDERNKGSTISETNIDDEKSALDYDTSDGEMDEKASKGGIIAGAAAAVSGLFGLNAAHKEETREHGASSNNVNKTTSQAINDPDQENHGIQSIGGGRYEVNEAEHFKSADDTHLESSREIHHHDSNMESNETRRTSRNSILGAAAAVGSALGLDHKNKRASRDHSSEYDTSQENSTSGIHKAVNQTSQNVTTAPQTLSSDVQDGRNIQFGTDHNKYGSSGSHQAMAKGVLSSAAASADGITGHFPSESHAIDIPTERTKSVPTLPRDTTNVTNQKQKQKVTTAPQILTGNVQGGNFDSRRHVSNDDSRSSTDSKYSKGKVAGVAAAVGGILGLNQDSKGSEQDLGSSDHASNVIPTERTKSVPKTPSNDSTSVGQYDKSVSKSSYGYDVGHNEQDNEKNVNYDKSNKGIIAGATGAAGAAAASVGNILGLSHTNDTSETETSQYGGTQIPSVHTKDVPGIPSKRSLFNSNKDKYGIPAERRKSVPGVKQYDQDDTNLGAHISENRQSSVQDNSSHLYSSREDSTDKSKSDKGLISGAVAGAAATVGSILGSKNKNSGTYHHITENEEYGISPDRTKSVPGVPSNSESRGGLQSSSHKDDYESSRHESSHNELDREIHNDRSEFTEDNQHYSNSSNHASQSKSDKGVIAGATAAVGSALGLDQNKSKINTEQQSAQPTQKYGIPDERTKSVPDIPSNTESHDSRHESSRYESRRNNLDNDNRYEYGQDNSHKFGQDDYANRYDSSKTGSSKSGKGFIAGAAGAAAAVGGALALDHKTIKSESRQDQSSDSYNDSTQQARYNQSFDDGQKVSTAPQNLTGDNLYGNSTRDDSANLYDHNRDFNNSRYLSTQDNNESHHSSARRGSIAGAVAGVAGALGLKNRRKSTDTNQGHQGTYDYKNLSTTNEHNTSMDHTLGADVRGSRHNNDHISGADVRGSRYNANHTTDADVRGSRYNSMQDDSRTSNPYDSNARDSYGKGSAVGAFDSGLVNNQSEIGSNERKKSAPGVPSKDFMQEMRHKSTQDNRDQSTQEGHYQSTQNSHYRSSQDHRYVSIQGSGQNADKSHVIGSSELNQNQARHSPVLTHQTAPFDRTKAVPVASQHYSSSAQGNNYESYELDASKSDRRSSSTNSGKGVIAAVGGTLGLNHSDKDNQFTESNNKDTTHVSDGRYESAYHKAVDPNKSKKGAIAGTVGAAGAAAATVGGVLGIKNKSTDPGNASDVLRRQGSTVDSLDGVIPNQPNSNQVNQSNSNQVDQDYSSAQNHKVAYSTRSDRIFEPKLSIDDKPDQGYTTSKRDRKTNSQQDQGFTTSQRDQNIKSQQYQRRVDSEVHPKVSNLHRGSTGSNYSNKAAGVAALGGMFGAIMYDQSTSDKSQHSTKASAQKYYYTQQSRTTTQDGSYAQKIPNSTQDSSYAQTIPTSTQDSSYAQKAPTVVTQGNSDAQAARSGYPDNSYSHRDSSSQNYAQSNTRAQDYSQSNTKSQDYSQSNAHRNSYAERNIESYARRNTGINDNNYGLCDDKTNASNHNTGGAGVIATTVAAAAATVGGALGLNNIDKKEDTQTNQGSDYQDTFKSVNDRNSTNGNKDYAHESTSDKMTTDAQKDYGRDYNMMSQNYMTNSMQDDSRYNQMADTYARDNKTSGVYSQDESTFAQRDQGVTTAPQTLVADNQYGSSTQGGHDSTSTSLGNSGVTTAPQTLAADNQYGKSSQGTAGNDGYTMAGNQSGDSTQDKTLNNGLSNVGETDHNDKGIIAGTVGAVGAAAATVGGALGLKDKNRVEHDGVEKYDSSVKYQDHAAQRNHSFHANHDQDSNNAAQTRITDSQTAAKSARTIPGSFTNGAGQNLNGGATGAAIAGGATGAPIVGELNSHKKTNENWIENNNGTIHRGQSVPVVPKNDNIVNTPPQSLANGTQNQTSPVAPQRRDQTSSSQTLGQHDVSTHNGITSGGLGAAGIAGVTGASALGSKNNTSESISSTRATTGKIIPDTRQKEIKDRHYENFNNTPNSIDNLNNPKRRNNSITQGLKSKFSSAVRRLSGQTGVSSSGRRLSDAEVYKNQQQAADYQQLAVGNNQQAFGGASAFGNVAAPVTQEYRQSIPDTRQQERKSSLGHVHNETSSAPRTAADTVPRNENGTIHRVNTQNTQHIDNSQTSNSLRDGQPLDHFKNPTTNQENVQTSNPLRDGQPLDQYKNPMMHRDNFQENVQKSDSLRDDQPLQHIKNNATEHVQHSGVKQNYSLAPGVYALKPVGAVDVDENGQVNMIKVKEGTKAVKSIVKANGVPIKDAAEISAYHANQ